MKLFKYILSLLFIILGFFSGDLKAERFTTEGEEIVSFSEQDFKEASAEKEWLSLLYLQEKHTSQDQIAFFGFLSGSLTWNFTGEICPNIYANDAQSDFRSIKKSGSHQGNGGWNVIVFNEQPDLVDSWRFLDEAGVDNLANKIDDIEFVRKYMDDFPPAGASMLLVPSLTCWQSFA